MKTYKLFGMNFSVLMSVYHKDKPLYLHRALQSLVDQTLQADEIILVEDGKLPFQLLSIIDSFRTPLNIKSIKLKKNSGLAIALNEGLMHCKYELIARMDSDDISLPYRFQRQVEFMIENPTISVISAYVEEINDQEKVVSIRELPLSDKSIVDFAKKRNPISHPCAFFRKSDVLAVGGYPDFRKAQDYALWSLMLVHGYKFMNVGDVLLRMQAGSAMYERRNISYLKQELLLLKYQRNIGFLNYREYVINAFSRTILRLSPRFIKEYIYQTMRLI